MGGGGAGIPWGPQLNLFVLCESVREFSMTVEEEACGFAERFHGWLARLSEAELELAILDSRALLQRSFHDQVVQLRAEAQQPSKEWHLSSASPF
eukprot:4312091-Amphidinium_carterae.1